MRITLLVQNGTVQTMNSTVCQSASPHVEGQEVGHRETDAQREGPHQQERT